MLGAIPNPEADQERIAHTGKTDYQSWCEHGQKADEGLEPDQHLLQAGSNE
jgi:hypothetical protein